MEIASLTMDDFKEINRDICLDNKSSQQLCSRSDCNYCINKSFVTHLKVSWWNHEINHLTPRQVFKSSGKLFCFTCKSCTHKYYATPNRIGNGNWCPYCRISSDKLCDSDTCKLCFDKSFASNPKAVYWNCEKNIKDVKGEIVRLYPRQFRNQSSVKCWFTCDICNHDFDTTLAHVNEGKWCPYCQVNNDKLCESDTCKLCFDKSFASHPKAVYWNFERNTQTPRKLCKNSHNNCWFTCDICNHDFDAVLYSINGNESWCPYCQINNVKLCESESCKRCLDKSFANNPKAVYWNFEKNTQTPRQLCNQSGVKCWFTCDICNHDFDTTLSHVNEGKWCPHCKNKTELLVYNFLLVYHPTIQRQFKTEWCKNINYLPFDFVIEQLQIIIEVDGPQHFTQISNWTSPEKQQQTDIYKMKCANENGYTVVRILQEDVWFNNYNWKKVLLNVIKQYLEPSIIRLRIN